MISRWKENNGTVYDKCCFLDLDLHTIQLTLLPTKFREVVNLSGLVVYKGSNTQGIMIMIMVATESKCEKINELVNSDGNMVRGPQMFTSDVSLPKDDKTAMRGKQITAGQLTGLKTPSMLTMLQRKEEAKSMGGTPK